jgi:hypothetical protein
LYGELAVGVYYWDSANLGWALSRVVKLFCWFDGGEDGIREPEFLTEGVFKS